MIPGGAFADASGAATGASADVSADADNRPHGWSDVVGQDAAVALLRSTARHDTAHAWLFLGPRGSGKRAAARAFAGDLLAAEADERSDADEAARIRTLTRQGQHADLIEVERVGAAISADQADEIVRRASRSPMEGARKVLVLSEFHRVAPMVGPKLLKTIEEPPPGTFFVVLAEELPPELVTIASRCVQVNFAPLTSAQVSRRLVSEGVDAEYAAEAAAYANGDLDRARLLAADDRLASRLTAWGDLPRRLDGTGATAMAVVDELRTAIGDAEAPLKARQDRELAEMAERVERYGQRGSGAKLLDEQHKRERRRIRIDELRMGLGSLAATYRDHLLVAAEPNEALAALAAIQQAAENLIRNPNEELLLLDLTLQLPALD